MKNLYFIKTMNGLEPYGDDTIQRFEKVRLGALIRVDIKQPKKERDRDQRRFFAMINFAYQYWEPDMDAIRDQLQAQGLDPDLAEGIKNKDRFREDILVLAGHNEMVLGTDGQTHLVAKSISYDKCSDEVFAEVYRASYEVVWNLVMKRVEGFDRQKFEQAVSEALSFGR